ncbi:MAG: amidohydrolase, partial [Bacteroidota bacterium]|nr:amidohydrolase [Bacteroidota bacterium]
MKTIQVALTLLLAVILTQCSSSTKEIDLLVFNGKIVTVDNQLNIAEGFAVNDGKIVEVGTKEELLEKYTAVKSLDLKDRYVYPGLIDAHCHFFGYGMNLKNADLTGTKSFEEIVEILKKHFQQFPSEWILGRGWDQNDWEINEFPSKEKLDEAFPDVPVFIRRIDGHGAIANSEALRRANITKETRIQGGDLILNKGELTGVLIDNAMGLVGMVIPDNSREEIAIGLLQAQENCFEVGLTAVFDAGLGKGIIELMDSLHKSGELKIRVNAWISPTEENFERFMYHGVYETNRLKVCAIKLFADGALGSRGAKLIDPYSDDPGNSGLLVSDEERLLDLCKLAYKHGYQVNTHCIGDSANRLMLHIYAGVLKENNDRRWRIEHSQVIHPDDFQLFGKYSIIPSIQPTHATSDMYWAIDRLGPERVKGAYAYKQLLEQIGWIPNGSDFPVEKINPLYGFYAAVARKDLKGFPEGGFQTENALSREEALKAMTIWAAKSGFEETRFGSLEPGKFADFIILEEDLMS